MLEKFAKYIKNNDIFSTDDFILVGVSGGMDSIFLITLLQRLNFNFGIAHCNFKLRGLDADKDEIFVQQFAKDLNRPFHSIQFNTKNIAKERKTSIQVTARDLRYEWFEKIRESHGYQYIATAHHNNDNIETVLYNIAKGCGIHGLHGILPKVNHIVRPILCFTRQEIKDFIEKNNIPYRIDKSNADTKYRRNFIRHEIIPKFNAINPNFDKTSQKFIERMRETEALMDFAIQNIQKEVVVENEQQFTINLDKLFKFPAPHTILYELLIPFGFNGNHIQEILQIRNHPSGKRFLSNHGYEAILNRNLLLIKKEVSFFKEFQIYTEGTFQHKHCSISIKNISKPNNLKTDSNTIILDKKALHFPLTIRTWKNGDSFQPFGMSGKSQKLQDFFSNQKLSLFEKENVKIMVTNHKILWIMGYRMADWAKITPKTNDFIKITYTKL